MPTVTGVLSESANSYASFLTPSLVAALTVDAVGGALSGLDTAWQSLFVGIRIFGKLTAVGQYQEFRTPGSLTPYALALLPVGPGVPFGYTVATLAQALLATAAQYGSGPLYTYTPEGYAAVTRVRTTVSGLTRVPYSVELQANPIPGGLSLEEA